MSVHSGGRGPGHVSRKPRASISAPPLDTTPDAFVFTDVTGATTSTQYTSNAITVAGLGTGVSVAVAVVGGTYSKNGGAYTSSAGTAQNGDTFAVRQTSSASNSTGTDVVLTIGGVSGTFTVTTQAAALTLAPSATWNGTAATGYAGSPPTQTGTAVACQFYAGNMHGTIACNLNWMFNEDFYPDAMFTDDLTIMVDGGDFDDTMTVTFYCEGNTVVLTDRVLVDLPVCTGYDGSGNPAFGTKTIATYAVTLDHSAFSGNGAVDLYAKAHSADVTIADRVIGPVRLFRRVDLVDGKNGFDAMKTVGTGGDYATVAAALAGHTTWWTSGQCVQLKCVSDQSIDPSVNNFIVAGSATNTKRGSVVIDANGHTVVAKRSTGNPNSWRPTFNGLVFKGVEFDLSNVTQLYSEDATVSGISDGYRPMFLIRCEIYGAGKFELAGGSPTVSNADAKTTRGLPAWRPEAAKFSCFIRDMHTGDNPAMLEVGNFQVRTSGDLHIIGSTLHRAAALFYNVYEDCDTDTYRNGTDAFTLYYIGAGTPGYRTTGTWNTNTRKLILTVGGSDVDTGIALSTTFGSGVYSVSDLVAAINTTYGASGWVATLVGDTYRAAMIGQETSTAVQSVGTSAGTATTVKAYAWLHMDAWQFSTSDNHDNHTLIGQELHGVSCQMLFPAITSTSASSYNCLARNNVGMVNAGGNNDSGDTGNLTAQISGDHFHLMIDHNTLANQGFIIRMDNSDTDLDATCSIRNNIFKFLGMVTPVAGTTNNAFVRDNFSIEANGTYTAVTGANTSGNVVGTSTPLTEFPDCGDAANLVTQASFTPDASAQARSNLKTPAINRDIAGAVRGSPSLCGAVAA